MKKMWKAEPPVPGTIMIPIVEFPRAAEILREKEEAFRQNANELVKNGEMYGI